jgi:hypothetical protein
VATQAAGLGMLPVCGRLFASLGHKLPSGRRPIRVTSLNL